MARMEHGLLGTFTGRIGNVVGYRRGGVQFIRSKSKKHNTSYSPAQVAHMAKFATLTKFLSPLRQFMNQAHQKTYKNKSGYHKLWSLNMQQILTGEYPDFKIDFHKVVITKGSMPVPCDATVACARPAKLVFTWRESINHDNDLTTDQVYVAVYNDASKSWKIFEHAAVRKDGKCTLDLTEFRGSPVQTYIGFVSANGLRVSNTQYLGMINVL